MKNKFRLHSDVFNRENDEEKIAPLKIFFLSVEGNRTEKEYFNGVSSCRHQLGINARVNVEVLGRASSDTNSDPKHVIELLEEYLDLRENGDEALIEIIPDAFVEKYGKEFIERYLIDENQISKKERNQFIADLKKVGFDIQYHKYLLKYDGEYDQFCIVIDRDAQSHSKEVMEECVQYCHEKGYQCYISNPCFEFWLLLHHSNVKEEYDGKLDEIKENRKLTHSHTYISKELSKKAGHGKSGIKFKEKYLPYVDKAIERAKEFSTDDEELIDNIGSNICDLFSKMRQED